MEKPRKELTDDLNKAMKDGGFIKEHYLSEELKSKLKLIKESERISFGIIAVTAGAVMTAIYYAILVLKEIIYVLKLLFS